MDFRRFIAVMVVLLLEYAPKLVIELSVSDVDTHQLNVLNLIFGVQKHRIM